MNTLYNLTKWSANEQRSRNIPAVITIFIMATFILRPGNNNES